MGHLSIYKYSWLHVDHLVVEDVCKEDKVRAKRGLLGMSVWPPLMLKLVGKEKQRMVKEFIILN